MTEIRSRVLLAGLTALLVGFALVNMVVDRRALAQGGRELSWWSGLALDVAVPVQKFVAMPFDLARGGWSDYVALIDVRRENGDLRAKLAETEDENLQLREALLSWWPTHCRGRTMALVGPVIFTLGATALAVLAKLTGRGN